MDEKKKIEEYVKLFGDIRERVGDEQIAARILHEIGKDRRMAEIRAERFNGNGGRSNGADESQPATPKQIDFITDLGGKPKPGLTKEAASRQIDELRANNGD